MQRILIGSAFGLAVGFRTSPAKEAMISKHAADDKVAVDEQAPQKALCSLAGDPHILTFDGSWKQGQQWHPTVAPGHWWLVNTESGKIRVQATYGFCSSATCLSGLAVSGSFIGRSKLIVQAPCDFDIKTRKCLNTDKTARITWNGQRVTGVNEGGVSVTVSGNSVKVKLPESMEIDVSMVHGNPPGFMDARITMVQGSGGVQCGHCGNFDGNWQNDHAYAATGALKPGAQGACDASVPCEKRLIPGDVTCNGIVPVDDKTPCPQEIRDLAEKDCKAKIAQAVDPVIASKIPQGMQDDELKDCIQDACSDKGFEGEDAKDDEKLDEALIKLGLNR